MCEISTLPKIVMRSKYKHLTRDSCALPPVTMELKNESLQYSSSCLSTAAIFHFRDYGRKSNSWIIIVIMGIQEKIVT